MASFWEKYHQGILAGIIPSLLLIIIFFLPFGGIIPPTNVPHEPALEPIIFLDFRSDDGGYHSWAFDLSAYRSIERTFTVKGAVPHPGEITVSIENYTLGLENDPGFFDIYKSKYRFNDEEKFLVDSGIIEKKVVLILDPEVKITDERIRMSLENYGTTESAIGKIFYRIEYNDFVEKSTTPFLDSEFLRAKWIWR